MEGSVGVSRQETDMKEIEYSKDYLILKAKEASLTDAFQSLLPSGSKKIKNLIICPEEKVETYTNFKARWSICNSILLQKFLFFLVFLFKILGRFWSFLGRFFFKLTRQQRAGFQQQPVAIAGGEYEYSSVVADDDTPSIRLKVRCREWKIKDANEYNNISNLEERDFKYYSSLTIMASKLAYHPHSFIHSVVTRCWKMDSVDCFRFRNAFVETASTQAFMFENKSKDITVIAFKGTSMFDPTDWMIDSNFSFLGVDGLGLIHLGFMEALGYQKDTGWPNQLPNSARRDDYAYYALRHKLRHIAKSNPNAKFIITGHSLGGALATLFVTLLAYHKETTLLHKIQGVYTYGQPRLGDQKFAEFMVKEVIKKYDIRYYRYVYSFDLVPRIPFDSIISNYKHFGGCVFFNCFYYGKFLKEQPNTNYFSIIWLIPKYLSAFWEFIISLIIIPIVKGMDYFEGFVMILERMLGLLIPGASAHVCSNYVNLTRWGKIQLPPNHIENFSQCIEPDHYFRRLESRNL